MSVKKLDLKSAPSATPRQSARPLRVIMVCQRDDPATGGAARVAIELCKRFPSYGVEAICVFAYGGPGDLSATVRPQTRWLRISSSRQALKGMSRLWRQIRKFNPDIIYHHDGLIWTHLVSWTFPNKLVIGHAHLDGPQPGAKRKKRLAHWVHAHSYKRLIAVSEFTKTRWQSLGYPKEKAIVLRNGVDASKFYPPTKDERILARARLNLPDNVPIMASVGRLHNGMKGTDDFLRVLARIEPSWHGLIAGSGPDRAALEQLAMELGILEKVHFLGTISPSLDAYHAADVLVITSHYEPFGLMAIEALASCLPVAGFECEGGVNEIMADANQPVIAARDIDAMALTVEEILGKPPARLKFLLEKYSWSAVTQELASLMKQWTTSGRS